MDGAVGSAVEVVDVGLVYGRAGETDKRACAKRDSRKVGGGELEVCFH